MLIGVSSRNFYRGIQSVNARLWVFCLLACCFLGFFFPCPNERIHPSIPCQTDFSVAAESDIHYTTNFRVFYCSEKKSGFPLEAVAHLLSVTVHCLCHIDVLLTGCSHTLVFSRVIDGVLCLHLPLLHW